jgi:formylmethanofuran dehydrogenase subunit B
MTSTAATRSTDTATLPWTCPFCALLCDGVELTRDGALELRGSDCPKARQALARQPADPAAVSPAIDGRAASLDEALNAAARLLAAATLPLFAGLATDVAGMRALYALASARDAILDHLLGDAIMASVRPLQDRGVYYTTLAEVRTRADLIVCFGTRPTERYPEFFRRIAPGEPRRREIVFVGTDTDPAAAGPDTGLEAVPLAGDAFDTLALLNALAADRALAAPPPGPLAGLAARLQAARYAVIVWEPGTTGPQGALVGEAINRLVGTLNARTRAASLALGGSQGGYTANQVVTWLSGLPLRTGLYRDGLRHDPWALATARVLADRNADLLLWVSSFDPSATPPVAELPTIVLGHAAMPPVPGAPQVFIPVATPGIGAAGHLFRLDGGVVVPLVQARDDGLPSVAAVAQWLARRLAGTAAPGAAADTAASAAPAANFKPESDLR